LTLSMPVATDRGPQIGPMPEKNTLVSTLFSFY